MRRLHAALAFAITCSISATAFADDPTPSLETVKAVSKQKGAYSRAKLAVVMSGGSTMFDRRKGVCFDGADHHHKQGAPAKGTWTLYVVTKDNAFKRVDQSMLGIKATDDCLALEGAPDAWTKILPKKVSVVGAKVSSVKTTGVVFSKRTVGVSFDDDAIESMGLRKGDYLAVASACSSKTCSAPSMVVGLRAAK